MTVWVVSSAASTAATTFSTWFSSTTVRIFLATSTTFSTSAAAPTIFSTTSTFSTFFGDFLDTGVRRLVVDLGLKPSQKSSGTDVAEEGKVRMPSAGGDDLRFVKFLLLLSAQGADTRILSLLPCPPRC
ncbi:hypothetical protein B0H14DRAFT_1227921 [Mycena olivaceomarginata]|nr:hypothetical protein B0H14DRAFT_1227921 [Mycena olivaceomarginata]